MSIPDLGRWPYEMFLVGLMGLANYLVPAWLIKAGLEFNLEADGTSQPQLCLSNRDSRCKASQGDYE